MTTPAAADDAIHLSVIATSRNDDHGGSLTRRTQHFIDGLVAQCKRHGLRAELILVEWNPPQERSPLLQELRWPADPGPCDIRIVTVPPEVHRRFQHADKIRLFQMLAKNAGVRRARGKFIMATNIDILFSDDAMRYLRDRLRPGCLYLADRADVPPELPATDDFGKILSFCDEQAFRINAGALTVERGTGRWSLLDKLKTAAGARTGYVVDLVARLGALTLGTITNPRWAFRRLVGHGLAVLETVPADPGSVRKQAAGTARPNLAFVLACGAWDIACRVASGTASTLLQMTVPFTNACGDFTVMASEDWFRIRGYAEWHVFSWHLDTLLVYQALGCGVRPIRLSPRARVFHIEHGGGYAPQRAAELFARLKERGIPFVTDEELRQMHADISVKRRAGQDVHLNGADWGLAALALPQVQPTAT